MPMLKTEAAESETLRQVAERIVRETILVVPGKIADRYIEAIEAALRNERERCAKVADEVETKWIEDARNVARADDLVGSLAQSTYNNYAEIAHNIAAAIREGR